MTKKRAIGDMLVEAHLVDAAQLAAALESQKTSGRKLGSVLVELGLVDENVLAAFLSKQHDIPCVSLLNVEIPTAVIRRVPAPLAHRVGAVPISIEGDTLRCAMVDPTEIEHLDLLEEATGLRIDPLVAPESSIRRVLARYYPLDDDGIPTAGATRPESFLFPELAQELEGATHIGARLDAIENELRALRGRMEELVDELRASRRRTG